MFIFWITFLTYKTTKSTFHDGASYNVFCRKRDRKEAKLKDLSTQITENDIRSPLTTYMTISMTESSTNVLRESFKWAVFLLTK